MAGSFEGNDFSFQMYQGASVRLKLSSMMLGYIPSILDFLAQIISIQYQHMNLQLKLQILLQVSLHYLKVSN